MHVAPPGSVGLGRHRLRDVDDDLARGLGLDLQPGLVYAGLAGATRWPRGQRSTNTLWSRVSGMHLGRKREFSTLRLTPIAILANAQATATLDEQVLTRWMYAHLRVIAVRYDDADSLGHVETTVLAELDPPLNLRGMPATAIRRRLSELRRSIGVDPQSESWRRGKSP